MEDRGGGGSDVDDAAARLKVSLADMTPQRSHFGKWCAESMWTCDTILLANLAADIISTLNLKKKSTTSNLFSSSSSSSSSFDSSSASPFLPNSVFLKEVRILNDPQRPVSVQTWRKSLPKNPWSISKHREKGSFKTAAVKWTGRNSTAAAKHPGGNVRKYRPTILIKRSLMATEWGKRIPKGQSVQFL